MADRDPSVFLKVAAGLMLLANGAPATNGLLDLSCRGTNRQGPAHAIGQAKPWQANLRVDLKRKAFCWDDCGEWHPVSQIDDARLLLVSRPSGELSVSRRSGELRMDMGFGDLAVIRRAQCRPRR